MSDRNVSIQAVQKFLALTVLFQREFRGAFSDLIDQSAQDSVVDVAVVSKAFMLACQRCLNSLSGESSPDKDSNRSEAKPTDDTLNNQFLDAA